MQLDSEKVKAGEAKPATYHFVFITAPGYKRVRTFRAPSEREACSRHCRANDNKPTPYSLVMRRGDGKRYSCVESAAIAGAAS